jgi:hypothetical protein
MRLIEVLALSEEEIKDVVILSKMIPKTVPLLFKTKEFKLLTFGQVLYFKNLISTHKSINTEFICKLAKDNGSDFSEKDLEKADAKNYFRTVNFIEDQFDIINSMQKRLETETDDKLINAGIEKLNVFGELNVIDVLAGGDILKWKKVLKLAWIDVYNKLYKNKIEQEIRDNLDLQREMETIAKNNIKKR